ncbi:uncharacterized protein N7484_005548 [Penicillium longicatenatum]|uniref:uncharacterized protein n=1 Tax=Penicillium longicatenatum TaxID=1561947 RepID=UPI0025499E02|nr:uncharacterized protein N7484_005548 [Penicillium longicatenatum]KAJ5643041.1 hypothetical protein N7484_005548 [Penicillium longicatenatum]KAJ5645574.1 hypothetical protein N7507_011585 [Penicillium longicatenatum]
MQYRLVALFAVTVTAVPIILTGGSNAVLPRSEDLIDQVDVLANVLSNGDSADVKKAKRGGISLGGVGAVEAASPIIDAGSAKRGEDNLVDPVSVGTSDINVGR